jgi:hypothetical protein
VGEGHQPQGRAAGQLRHLPVPCVPGLSAAWAKGSVFSCPAATAAGRQLETGNYVFGADVVYQGQCEAFARWGDGAVLVTPGACSRLAWEALSAAAL